MRHASFSESEEVGEDLHSPAVGEDLHPPYSQEMMRGSHRSPHLTSVPSQIVKESARTSILLHRQVESLTLRESEQRVQPSEFL